MSNKEKTTNEIILTKELEQEIIIKAYKTMAQSVANELAQDITQYSLLANNGEEKYRLIPTFIITNLIQRLTAFAQEDKGKENATTQDS